jgi:SAM-dependent methyltransferase
MEAATYAAEADIEANHWWFVVRRGLFARTLRGLKLALDAPILDVGTGTGANLRMLREQRFTNISGVDFSPEAIRFCAAKGLGVVRQGDICDLPFPANHFAAVLATDVIEHVRDDSRALSEIERVLRPGGTALITVPAFPSLWGLQDEVAHHQRRYRMMQLRQRLHQARLVCAESFYFNYLLFGPIWLARQIIRWSGKDLRSENDVNSPVLNRLLTGIFAIDAWSAPYLRPPFGVSILAQCVKPATAGLTRERNTA